MKKTLTALSIATLAYTGSALAEDYAIDTQGQHAFIQFKISHLGYSYIFGRFDEFDGTFSYDEADPSAATVNVTVNTDSINTNHAERDKHLRSGDFLDVSEFPEATFVSTGYSAEGDSGTLEGDLTLHGVTKPVSVDITMVGAGEDPWGGFRRGFTGSTTITLADFGIDYNLGPASRELELIMSIEGVRQ